MRTATLTALFLFGCNTPSESPQVDAEGPHGTQDAAQEDIHAVAFTAVMTDLSGKPVSGGTLCADTVCESFDRASAAVALPAWEAAEVWVDSRGIAVHTQFVTADHSLTHQVIVPSSNDLDRLAHAFGIRPDPTKGTLVQFLIDEELSAPMLSTEDADGPFLFDKDGKPVAQGSTSAAYYAYFNIAPGQHELDFGGCEEGPEFWGAPGDGRVDVWVAENAVLTLQPIVCL